MEGGFKGIKEPGAHAVFNHNPVNHNVNLVLFIFIKFRQFFNVVNLTINLDPDKTVLFNLLKDLLLRPLLVPDYWRKDL